MDRAWIELLVRDAAGTSTGDDFVGWAEHALIGGFDSPALRQLAGLEGRPRSDAKPLFDRAVRELGLTLPATEGAARELARRTLKKGGGQSSSAIAPTTRRDAR